MEQVWFVAWGDGGDFRFPRRSRPAANLAETVAFAEDLVPAERVLAVVLEQNRPWWQEAVAALPLSNVVEQPLDRGTGPGILASALRVLLRDPEAMLVLVGAHAAKPSRRAVLQAVEVARAEGAVVLLPRATVGTDEPARILPVLGLRAAGAGRDGVEVAEGVLESGHVTVLSAMALVDLFEGARPELLTELTRPDLMPDAPDTLDLVFPFLPDTDFVQQVLAPSAQRCRLLVAGC